MQGLSPDPGSSTQSSGVYSPLVDGTDNGFEKAYSHEELRSLSSLSLDGLPYWRSKHNYSRGVIIFVTNMSPLSLVVKEREAENVHFH